MTEAELFRSLALGTDSRRQFKQDVSNADGLPRQYRVRPRGNDGLKNVLIQGGCRRISTDVSGRPRLYPDTNGLSG